jgi:hypothetical protein
MSRTSSPQALTGREVRDRVIELVRVRAKELQPTPPTGDVTPSDRGPPFGVCSARSATPMPSWLVERVSAWC